MNRITTTKLIAVHIAISAPFAFTQLVAADPAGVTQIDNFIRSLITIGAGIAGLVATGFFVVGGFSYITSSGNPEHMDRAKKTISNSMIGLAICIGAAVLTSVITELATKAFGN